MTITLQAVNELIASLEAAGELSIREQKFLKLAKAFKQLAAENVAIREQSEEVYAAGYGHGYLNTVDGIAYVDCVEDDFYGLALQVMAEVETPTTDCIVAGIKADGVEEFAAKLRIPGDDQFFDALAKGVALAADDFAKQLREGADK
ncbi:hypothetical protein [Klebsiella pneumoniae]|uniref:hypothetical protein n=1 Tax=Klebsiella pneumoniae TaxID=573 RepID=UPI002A2307F3|nr:hypothetical protein [Klebsiella pneumoniae]HDE2293690.1 hypothetical protein [Klebsiella pneumoniae]HEK4996413.1 hypothetical protein [Klebsiella pneumoniae]HEK7584170.1 hypothetical protein [Klebsiella pneumoniae]